MYKIMKSAEKIAEEIQLEFGDKYEVTIDDDFSYSATVKIRSNILFLNVFISKHHEFKHDNSISSIDNSYVEDYSTINITDYYGNKRSDISSNYMNEISSMLKSIEDKMDRYFYCTKDLILRTNEKYSEGLGYIINEKQHFFIKSKNNILRFKPRLNINNDKIIIDITPVISNYNEPVLSYDIDNCDYGLVVEDILFFL